MKKKFECTKENPLHSQLSNLNCSLIQEITVKGFLCDEDYELLTKMGAGGISCVYPNIIDSL